MLDIDTITNAWGKWKSAQYGTTIWFTESTNYGRNGDTAQYMQYQTNVTPPRDLMYSSVEQADGGAALLGRYDVRNGSSQVIKHTVNLQQGIQDSFTWNITESVKVGVSVNVKAEIPFIGGAETNFNTEFSLSTMQGSTKTKSSTYGTSTTIPISPHTHSWGQVDLSFTDLATSWVGNVELQGYVAIWFNDNVAIKNDGDYHHLWFIPIQNVFIDCINNNIINTQGYVIQSNGVAAQARGSFHSSRGLSTQVVANEEPINRKRKEKTTQSAENVEINAEQAIAANDI